APRLRDASRRVPRGDGLVGHRCRTGGDARTPPRNGTRRACRFGANAATRPDPMETTAITPLGKILDLLLDAICVVDAEGRYVFVSAAFERIFGYAPEEVIGRRMIELVHPEDRDVTLRTAAAIMDGKPESNFQNRYVRKDGEVVHIMWSARWSEADRVRIAEAAHAAQDLPMLFEQVHRIIGGILPATNFLIALHDRTENRLRFPCVAYGEHEAEPEPEALAADPRLAAVIRSGQPVQLAAAAGDGATRWLGVPLQSKDGAIGALVVEHRGKAGYSDADSELLQFVATQVST